MKVLRKQRDGLVILPGHAIWKKGRWYGGLRYVGENKLLGEHVQDAFRLCRDGRFGALAFSGGATRPHIPQVSDRTEAEGLQALGAALHLDPGPAVLIQETFARDSFENVLFSLCAYYRHFGRWPTRVSIVSFKFKATRFYLAATGLKLPQFSFHGSGDVPPAVREPAGVGETRYVLELLKHRPGPNGPEFVLHDPFHRAPEFALKRRTRTPAQVKNPAYLARVKYAYDAELDPNGKQGVVGDLIDTIEDQVPGSDWRQLKWPWWESA